ncbi:hypothetical protein FQN54_006511 [Arachnomyces sp. PD_36]|nr:hypothetical protein FQN54_006511 [Arachnomyces sp. PD_36]
MHISLPVLLSIGLLPSLGLASSLSPKSPKWVEDIKSHIEEHQEELTNSQIEALNDALVLTIIRDEKLAPEMKGRMIDAFGEKEARRLLKE